jgi:hypothetical protein|tara:strand:- start:440 stop:1078 length:639 start_codon:yes stop_codon:yes gene_type:complete
MGSIVVSIQRTKTPGFVNASGMMFKLLIGLMIAIPEASSRSYEEHEIKAAFLYSFAQFITWETRATTGQTAALTAALTAAQTAALTYCAVHEGPVVNALKELIAAKQTAGETRRYTLLADLSNIRQCHILFLGADNNKSESLQLRPEESVLTVGDSQGFVANGGIIEFRRQGARVQVHINLATARAQRIQISSKLLKLATIYNAPDEAKIDD